MARPVIIDCDPGQDDAVMLLLACASPELDILGVTTVAGNVPLELTHRNARLMLELAGRGDIPVYAGCDRPLVRAPITAEAIHGRTGIDGYPVRDPALPLAAGHAVDFIVATCRAADDVVSLVPTGPLTNNSPGERPSQGRSRPASSTMRISTQGKGTPTFASTSSCFSSGQSSIFLLSRVTEPRGDISVMPQACMIRMPYSSW